MQNSTDIGAERMHRFNYLKQSSPLIFGVSVTTAAVTLFIRIPSMPFLLANLFAGLSMFYAWWFSLQRRESLALFAVLFAIVLGLVSLSMEIHSPFKLILPQGLSLALTALSVGFLYVRFISKG